MVVLIDDGKQLTLRRASWRDRLRSRLRASHLDRQLAGGTSPESDGGLAIRAQRLVAEHERRHLAASLERVLVSADRTRSSRLPVPVHRAAVRSSSRELRSLIDGLRAGVVDVRATATVRTLLSDGGSSLYRGSVRDLRVVVQRATGSTPR